MTALLQTASAALALMVIVATLAAFVRHDLRAAFVLLPALLLTAWIAAAGPFGFVDVLDDTILGGLNGHTGSHREQLPQPGISSRDLEAILALVAAVALLVLAAAGAAYRARIRAAAAERTDQAPTPSVTPRPRPAVRARLTK